MKYCRIKCESPTLCNSHKILPKKFQIVEPNPGSGDDFCDGQADLEVKWESVKLTLYKNGLKTPFCHPPLHTTLMPLTYGIVESIFPKVETM